MRKLFTLFALCMLASTAMGIEVVFDATVDVGTGSSTAGAFVIEKEGIKIEVAQGVANGTHYRFYKNQPVTITSSIGAMNKVVFTCVAENDAQYGPAGFGTVTPEGYSYGGNEGTWTGSSDNIIFNPTVGQVRATKIVVTVDNAGLAAPTISPAGGTYYDPISVTIKCGTADAKIYYTLDGSTPTTNSTAYTAPFNLSANTTVKAISAKDGEVSDVVEATYEFATAVTVANLAEYSAKPDETVVKFANPVYAVAQSGKTLYVMDNSGYGLFYGTIDPKYTLGNVIPAGFVGRKTTYNGEPELADLASFNEANGTVELTAEPITTAMVNHEHWAHYVYFETATFDPEAKTITDAVGTAPVYFSLGVTQSQVKAGTEYEVWAIVAAYKPKEGDVIYQIIPIKVKPKGIGGFGLGQLPEIDDNTDVTIEYDAIVLGQSGSYLYLKDETGYGLVYGSTGKSYTFGDQIPAGYGGQKTTWDAEPELKNPTGFQNATGNIGGIEALNKAADSITPDMVSHEIWGHYVKLTQVLINTSEKTFTDANGQSCPYYDRFGTAMPSDLNKRYDVYGIVASYGKTNTVYQILPTYIDAPIDTLDVANIPELYQLNEGAFGHFTTSLTTIYQNGQNLYVKDVDGNYSLVYGTVAYSEFKNGDFINDAVASWTMYSGNKQMKPVADTFVKAGHSASVKPEMMPVEEISQDMLHWFLGFENVNIITKEVEGKTNYYLVDETGELWIYDKFNLGVAELDLTKTYNVEGFLTIYKGSLELYPTKISSSSEYPRGDVNGDGEVNITDINALIDIILGGTDNSEGRSDVNGDGEVNISDVNDVIDIILGGH